MLTRIAFLLMAPIAALAGTPAITVYNQNFGVVREVISLDLASGVNDIAFANATAHVEPDSVILRDPTGRRNLRILEQNYRNDPASQSRLLALFEGETIDFLVSRGPGAEEIVKGRIVRSGYVPHQDAWSRYGQDYYQTQMAITGGGANTPIIEIDGKLRFGLPGIPLFPALGDDTILKPTLTWKLATDTAGPLDAELAYITGGMSWEADYNITGAEKGATIDITGWVTIDNQTGRTFQDARIKLMAGDVSRIQEPQEFYAGMPRARVSYSEAAPVTEKTFDEYHLYTLSNPTTLRDSETKQVEFIRAAGVKASRIYVYDGAKIQFHGGDTRFNQGYGSESNPKVWVMREFMNSADNQLGIPLPAGRMRFYQHDADDAQLEFVGENQIDHTPKDERIRVYTGNAFDIVGERTQTDYQVDQQRDWLDESFEITLRNHKEEAVEVRVVERLYRWVNWEIQKNSDEYSKTDARTIEFRVNVPADGEKKVTYKVHYSW